MSHPTDTFQTWAGPSSPWQTLAPTDDAALSLPLGASSSGLPWLVFIGESSDGFSEDWLRSFAADDDFLSILHEYCHPAWCTRQQAPLLAAQAQIILAATAGGRGWPLLLICDAEGRAVGATPFGPLREGHGRPGTMTVVIEALAALGDDPATMAQMATQIGELLKQVYAPQAFPEKFSQAKSKLLRDSAEAALFEQADTLNGGFGPMPHYWQPGLWEFVTQRIEKTDCPKTLRNQAEKTMLASLTGACWDQLGGGVLRAAANVNWATCLAGQCAADQSYVLVQLVRLGRSLGQPIFLQAAQQIAQSGCAGLLQPHGVVAGRGALAPLGGVGARVDGGHLAWNEDAAAAIIGAEGAGRFARVFLADEAGNLPNQHTEADPWRVPARRQQALDEHDAERLAVLCQRLAAARTERPGPEQDITRYLADQGRWLWALGTLLNGTSDGASTATDTSTADNETTTAGAVDFAASLRPQVDAVLGCLADWAKTDGHPLKWDSPGALPADAVDLAWINRGLAALPAEWIPDQGDSWQNVFLAVLKELPQDSPLRSPLDEADQPAPLAVLAAGLLACGHPAAAQQLIRSYGGAIINAPAAGLSVLAHFLEK
jgi:hypothetical protein